MGALRLLSSARGGHRLRPGHCTNHGQLVAERANELAQETLVHTVGVLVVFLQKLRCGSTPSPLCHARQLSYSRVPDPGERAFVSAST